MTVVLDKEAAWLDFTHSLYVFIGVHILYYIEHSNPVVDALHCLCMVSCNLGYAFLR